MRIAISNIAWNVNEDEAMVNLFQRYQIDAVDVAPGKYFPDLQTTARKDVERVKIWWADHGIELTGMQSLLFGTTGLNLFATEDIQEKMLSHLTAICRIGGWLGAKRLVFGSPKNRDRTGFNDYQSVDMAVAFFRRLGDIAESYGVIVCLEPNPIRYGANFMNTSEETAEIVQQVAHSAIKMQLDTGSITINGEDVDTILKNYSPLIGHIHASEPDLVPLGEGATNHVHMSAGLKTFLKDHIVTVEMLTTKTESTVVLIERALKVAIHHYRGGGMVYP